MALTIGDVVANIKADMSNFNKGMADAKESTNDFGDNVKRVAGVVGTALAAIGIAKFAKESLTMAGNFEQSQVAFTTMLGSAEKANDLLKDITKFAAKTPFELPGIITASKQLLAYGFAQESIIPAMTQLGDLASGLGVPIDQLVGAFGKVKVAGQLTGETLMQFTNAGVPMMQALADTMGVSVDKVKDLVSKGKVGFPQVQKAMEAMTGEGSQFGGMMEKQSQTFLGAMSNIKDGFGQIMTQVGTAMLPVAKEFAAWLNEKVLPAIKDLVPAFTDLITKGIDKAKSAFSTFNEVVVPIISDLVGWIVNEALPKFKNLADAVAEFYNKYLADLIGFIVKDVLPVLGDLVVLGFNALKDAIGFVLDTATAVLQFLNDNKAAVELLTGVIGGLVAIWAILNGVMFAQAAWAAVVTFFSVTLPAILTAAHIPLMALSTTWMALAVPIALVVTFGAVMEAIKKVQELMRNVNALQGNIDSMNEQIGMIDERIAKAKEAGDLEKVQDLNVLKAQTQQAQAEAEAAKNPGGIAGMFANMFGHNANGVRNWMGGLSWVGETGPELVNLPRGSDVYSNRESKAMVTGGGVNQQIDIAIQNVNSAVDLQSIGREFGFRVGLVPGLARGN